MIRFLYVLILCSTFGAAYQPFPAHAQTDSLARASTDTLSAKEDSQAALRLDPIDFQAVPVVRQHNRRDAFPKGWFFLLNCGLLMLMAFKFLVFPQYSRKSWNALVNESLFFQFIREKSPITLPAILIEAILRLYMVSIAALLILGLLSPAVIRLEPVILLRISVLFAAFFGAKIILSFLLAVLTDQVEYFKIQNFSNVIISSNAAWIVLPLILLVMYLPGPVRIYGIYALLLVFGLVITVLLFRSVRIISKTGMAVNVQFFLYLCAFEIIPYLFVIRIFENNLV